MPSAISPALPELTLIPGPWILPYTDQVQFQQVSIGVAIQVDGICHMFLAFVTFVLICTAPFPAQGFSKPQDTLPVGAMKDLMTPATINCMGQHGCLLGSSSHFSVI